MIFVYFLACVFVYIFSCYWVVTYARDKSYDSKTYRGEGFWIACSITFMLALAMLLIWLGVVLFAGGMK
jgi:hypothetical protein